MFLLLLLDYTGCLKIRENSECGRERPSGARKIHPEEDLSTLILFNT
jgi:hypothetical protein